MDFTDKLDILYARRSSEDGKDGESIEKSGCTAQAVCS